VQSHHFFLASTLIATACGTGAPASTGQIAGSSGAGSGTTQTSMGGDDVPTMGGGPASIAGGGHAGTTPSSVAGSAPITAAGSADMPAASAGASGSGGTLGSAGGSGSGGASTGGVAGQASGDHWKPKAGLTWQWQLSEDVATPLAVDVYDIDWESDKAVVDKLHAAGIKVICYVSVGSWEDFRPDAKAFPAAVIGNDYTGWPGEKYVDIRADALRAVMSARFDICKSKGFDAIEPDNMDVFEIGSDSGFPLSENDGVAYANWLATAAHSRGLGIGQKNASSITSSIAATYDWALTESCYSDGNWCGDVKAYATANKPVFMCEYEAKSFNAACSAWKPKSYSPILKGLDLDSPVTFCP